VWGSKGWGEGGEMTQTLYARMNKRKKKLAWWSQTLCSKHVFFPQFHYFKLLCVNQISPLCMSTSLESSTKFPYQGPRL
jgi:hypothetical protein